MSGAMDLLPAEEEEQEEEDSDNGAAAGKAKTKRKQVPPAKRKVSTSWCCQPHTCAWDINFSDSAAVAVSVVHDCS
jgi:hypothetical protein